MKREQLSEALNQLDEEIIEETGQIRSRKRSRAGWKEWTAAAACLAVVLSAGFWALSRTEFFSSLISGESSGGGSGSSGESGASDDLPLLTIPTDDGSSMGYEGYMAYNAGELVNSNPWQEGVELDTLPVYRNRLTYAEGYIPKGADFAEMERLLREAAGRLGLDADNLVITDDVPSEEKQEEIRAKMESVEGGSVPEGYFDPTELRTEGDGVKLKVSADLSLRIEFDPPRAMPEGIPFGYYVPFGEMDAAADYFLQKFPEIIAMENPKKDISGGDYNIYGEQGYQISFFEDNGDITQRIINYNFNKIAFSPNDNRELWLIDISHLNGEKIGDYPIITLEEAKALLAENHFITTVPYDMPGTEYIAKAELLYRTGRDEIYMPYYRFLVELPEMEREGGLKDYGAYYVPAVAGEYLTNMPTWDGSFNS